MAGVLAVIKSGFILREALQRDLVPKRVRVSGFGFRQKGLRGLGFRFRVLGFGFRVLGFRVLLL